MRRASIAVCLLLAFPSSVLGCIDEHNPQQTGWSLEMPSTSWSFSSEGAAETRMLEFSMIGAGVASLALVGVSFRALSRSAARGPMLPAATAENEEGDEDEDREYKEGQMRDSEFEMQDSELQYV
jgi:hypothetical protein